MSYMKNEFTRLQESGHGVCLDCGTEIIENVCQCGDMEDRDAIQVELRDKAERRMSRGDRLRGMADFGGTSGTCLGPPNFDLCPHDRRSTVFDVKSVYGWTDGPLFLCAKCIRATADALDVLDGGQL